MYYADIVDAAKSYADRNDVEVSDKIDTFIIMAESKINRVLRTYEQTHRISTATFEDREMYSLPDDYNGMRAIQFNTGQVDAEGSKPYALEYITPELMIQYQAEDRRDEFYYTVVAQQIQVHPTLPANGTLELLFYRKVPNLNSQHINNWCSENHPDIYVSGLCAEIELFVKNYEVAKLWNDRMVSAIQELTGSDIEKRWAGNSLTMRVE